MAQFKLTDSSIPMLSAIENIPIGLSAGTLINHNNNSNTNNINSNNCVVIQTSNSQQNTLLAAYNGGKVPKAILVCHPNSHAFLDRTLILDKPVKIGRSVGHSKACLTNGIFDCKVLSRNHALIWCIDEKFYIKDTKSSNGTFVNRERLSRSVEESSPQEIYSGDTVQFGVDVVESSHITHGCIIAILKLFLPDGTEAKPPPTPLVSITDNKKKTTLEDLYHLNEYIQEALQREQMLKGKLASLCQLVEKLRESTELDWKALISNNSLLSRVELLEIQLQCYSKKFEEDKLIEELHMLQEDKTNYQGAVKEFFQKIIDEKLEAVQKCQDLARALNDSKTECSNTKQLLVACQNELRELAQANTKQEKTIEELQLKLHTLDQCSKELQNEKNVLEIQMKNHLEREEMLQRAVKDLETHGGFSDRQVYSLQCQVDEIQKYHSQILCELMDPEIIKERGNNLELIKSWVEIYQEAQKKSEQNASALRSKVNEMRNEKITKQQNIAIVECELDKYGIDLQNTKDEVQEIEQKVRSLEKELEILNPSLDLSVVDELNGGGEEYNSTDILLVELLDKKKYLTSLRKNVKVLEEKCVELEQELQNTKDRVKELTVCYMIEEDKLSMSEKHNLNLQKALKNLRERAESLKPYQDDSVSMAEIENLKMQLSDAHEISEERQNVILSLIRYWGDFTNNIDFKLSLLEQSIGQFLEFTDWPNLGDSICSLKNDATNLKCAINQLQENVNCISSWKRSENLSLSSESNLEISKTLESGPADSVDNFEAENAQDMKIISSLKSNAENNPSDILKEIEESKELKISLLPTRDANPIRDAKKLMKSNKSDDLVVLKEKYKILLHEKLKADDQLVKLRDDFYCVTNYPNFDFCFVLPIILLLCVVLFKYSDIFSFCFTTSE